MDWHRQPTAMRRQASANVLSRKPPAGVASKRFLAGPAPMTAPEAAESFAGAKPRTAALVRRSLSAGAKENIDASAWNVIRATLDKAKLLQEQQARQLFDPGSRALTSRQRPWSYHSSEAPPSFRSDNFASSDAPATYRSESPSCDQLSPAFSPSASEQPPPLERTPTPPEAIEEPEALPPRPPPFLRPPPPLDDQPQLARGPPPQLQRQDKFKSLPPASSPDAAPDVKEAWAAPQEKRAQTARRWPLSSFRRSVKRVLADLNRLPIQVLADLNRLPIQKAKGAEDHPGGETADLGSLQG
ncbi:hypothetical protein T484DRAFT_1843817 [Baffinella frigidus]|nr:hypothetical protein T484DRAFT_1843817 [Cryptophyta sp. CCMP2293]